MKKRTKLLWGLFILLMLIGGIIMSQKDFLTKKTTQVTREQQIAYLKKHEQEMTDAIKKNHPKVESIQWDWDSVKVETIGNGTPQGGGTMLTISGRFNDIKDSSFTLGFELESAYEYPDMDEMIMMQDLTIDEGAKSYE